MGQHKGGEKTVKRQAKSTKSQTRSLLDSLEDKTKGLNTAHNNVQALVWNKALNDLNESFHLQLDLDQVKNHFAQVSLFLNFDSFDPH